MGAQEIDPAFEDLSKAEIFKTHLEELSKEPPEPDRESLLNEKLQYFEVKSSDELRPPAIAWQQNTSDHKAVLGTLGNFSLIIGKAKSRKSFFINIAVSTVLKQDLFLNQFKGCLPENKKTVLYFDTEQGKYHVQLALKRICDHLNTSAPENLKVYGLRSLKPSERLELIEHAINNTENLGFVVIDGIKDLLTSINDEEQATMIASKLLKWTEEKEIHIVTVLHQNKSDNNARGHIGTELINKAETVLSVTKSEQDSNISIVEAQLCRSIEPEPFAFEIIEGLPVLAENYKIRTATKREGVSFDKLQDHELFELLNMVFLKDHSVSYAELVRLVKFKFKERFKKDIGDNKAKELITICKDRNWLLQEKPKAPYTLGTFKPINLF
jgi:N-dimethylarginine dimethylaminohydrolase